MFTFFEREVRGMHQAAYLLALSALLSQLLALLRDRLLATSFGPGPVLDVYYASFRLPDLLFVAFASLFSLYAILPVFAKTEGESRAHTIALLDLLFLVFFLLMAAVSSIAFVFAPSLVALLAPGFEGVMRDNLILVTRILLLQPILLGASNILASLTQLKHRFLLYGVSPLLYNLGIIFGILVLYPRWGIGALGAGAVLGACLHAAVQLPSFFKERAHAGVLPRLPFKDLKRVLALSVPRTLALLSGQATLISLVAVGSTLLVGSISVLTLALNLEAVPLTIIGVSYSVAAFPTLAQLFSRGELVEFRSHIETALRHLFFWSFPALILVIVLRAQIVRVILGSGAFDWDATRLTAAALALLSVGILAQGIVLLLTRGYYAAGKTLKPLVFAAFSVLASVSSALFFLKLFSTETAGRYFIESLLRVSGIEGTDVLMLAAGFSLGAVVQALLILVAFARDFDLSLKNILATGLESFAASVVGGFAAYGALLVAGSLVDINTFAGIFAQGFAGGIVGIAAISLLLFALKNRAFGEVLSALRRNAPRTPVAIEPSELSS
ncbi:MAG TPA: lipid II flippase MurJ [Candidatus Paceibacterota bacterium]